MTRTAAGVAVAGVAATVPAGLAGASTKPAHAAPATAAPSGADLETPVIAHVRDLRTGEVAIYAGEHEITVHDRTLAQRLVAAGRI